MLELERVLETEVDDFTIRELRLLTFFAQTISEETKLKPNDFLSLFKWVWITNSNGIKKGLLFGNDYSLVFEDIAKIKIVVKPEAITKNNLNPDKLEYTPDEIVFNYKAINKIN